MNGGEANMSTNEREPGMRSGPLRRHGGRALRLLAVLGIALGCHRKAIPPVPTEAEEEPEAASPDRLRGGEHLPAAETAFGLTIPTGLRLARHFNDSVYFTGETSSASVIDQIESHIVSSPMEMMSGRAVFSRAYVKGDATRRILRIEVAATPHGTQLYLKDITPDPAPQGLSQTEMWGRAGRTADGVPIDQNQLY
jgi:hypothetical protein